MARGLRLPRCLPMQFDNIEIASIQNPDATDGLKLTILLGTNVSSEQIAANIHRNSRLDVPWLFAHPPHDGVAVIVAGGPSAGDFIEEIARRQWNEGKVFALNGASAWLRSYGIEPDCQAIIDAKPETLELLDKATPLHFLASQVDPSLFEASENPMLMHLSSEGCEDHIPDERREAGGYVLLGGGYGSANTAICLAYALGFREMHCYGFDSSHRGMNGHCYAQMPGCDDHVETEFMGTVYRSTLPMKAQADRFQIIAGDLVDHLGCKLHVHGDGLLPAMWNNRATSQKGQ